jgi:uncharacterized Zn-binding protein involved in type VI secretion
MAAYFLHEGATILCSHGAQVSVTTTNQRVKVSGQPVATLADTFTVSGCPFQIPIVVGTKPQPCVTLRWVTAAGRVRVNGQPVILQSSQGLCQSAEQIPQGNGTVASTQTRVGGS